MINDELPQYTLLYSKQYTPDSKVHWANMGPTWVLSAPVGPHVGPMNLAIRVLKLSPHDALTSHQGPGDLNDVGDVVPLAVQDQFLITAQQDGAPVLEVDSWKTWRYISHKEVVLKTK